jgi:hypothetical protein
MTTLAPNTDGIATLGGSWLPAILGPTITMIGEKLRAAVGSQNPRPVVRARDITTVPGVRADRRDWLRQALDRLDSVASLPYGWDSEGGPPPNSQFVEATANLLQYLQRDDLPLPFVCPIAGGGLQLEWSSGGKEVELELVDECTIGFLRTEAAPSGRIIESGEYPISDINKSRELLDWLAEA